MLTHSNSFYILRNLRIYPACFTQSRRQKWLYVFRLVEYEISREQGFSRTNTLPCHQIHTECPGSHVLTQTCLPLCWAGGAGQLSEAHFKYRWSCVASRLPGGQTKWFQMASDSWSHPCSQGGNETLFIILINSPFQCLRTLYVTR